MRHPDALGRTNPGRPPRLNNRTAHLLCALIREGVGICDALDALGIAASTYLRWVRRGMAGGEANGPNSMLYRELVDGLAAARQERTARVAELLAQAREHDARR